MKKFYKVISPYFLTSFFLCFVASVIFLSVIEKTFQEKVLQTEHAILNQVKLALQNEILVSDKGRIKYHCESLIKSNLLAGIVVKDSSEEICSLGRTDGRVLIENIYYDESEAFLAGQIKITPVKSDISPYRVIVFSLILIFFVFIIGLMLKKKLEARLSKEIESMSKSINQTLIGYSPDSQWDEVSTLLNDVKLFSDQLKVLQDKEQELSSSTNSIRRLTHDLKAVVWQINKEHPELRASSHAISDLEIIVSKLNNFESDINVNEFLEKLNSLMKLLEANFKVKIALNIHSDNIDFPNFGYFNLFLIIKNLIFNSIEANKHSFLNINVSFLSKNDFSEVVIDDDGIGFPEGILSIDLMKPVISSKINGNGIGLNEIKKFIMKFNGNLSVCNRSGASVLVEYIRGDNLVPLIIDLDFLNHKNNAICFIDDDKYLLLHLKQRYPAFDSIHSKDIQKINFSNYQAIIVDANPDPYRIEEVLELALSSSSKIYVMSNTDKMEKIGKFRVEGFIPKSLFYNS